MHNILMGYHPMPIFPPELETLANEFQRKFKVGPELARISIIGGLSAGFQRGAYIEPAPGHHIWLNTYTYYLGPSGTSKSPVQEEVFKPHNDFDRELMQAAVEARYKYDASAITWTEEKNFYASEIRRCLAEGRDDGIYHANLEQLFRRKPREPVNVGIMLSDSTDKATIRHLHLRPSAVWIATETGPINAALRGTIPNQLWASTRLKVNRVAESLVLDNVSLTIAAQTHAESFYTEFEKGDQLGIVNGSIARFLLCEGISAVKSIFDILVADTEPTELPVYTQKISEELRKTVPLDPTSVPPMIRLEASKDAKIHEQQLLSYFEQQTSIGQPLQYAQEAARKGVTNAWKLAGLFHRYKAETGLISGETFHFAAQLTKWFVHEQARFLSRYAPLPLEVRDRHELLNYLTRFTQTNKSGIIPKGHLLSYGPLSLRKAHRMDAVLTQLQLEGALVIHRVKKAAWVILNPGWFNGIQLANSQSLPPHLQYYPTW